MNAKCFFRVHSRLSGSVRNHNMVNVAWNRAVINEFQIIRMKSVRADCCLSSDNDFCAHIFLARDNHLNNLPCNWYILLRQEIKTSSNGLTGVCDGDGIVPYSILIGISVRIANKQPHDSYQSHFPTREFHHLSTSFPFLN